MSSLSGIFCILYPPAVPNTQAKVFDQSTHELTPLQFDGDMDLLTEGETVL